MVVGQHELVPSTATIAAAPGAPAPAQPLGAGIKTRILSLDAFRGFVMFLMLAEAMHLMNVRRAYPDSTFWSWVAFNTTHVPWQGCFAPRPDSAGVLVPRRRVAAVLDRQPRRPGRALEPHARSTPSGAAWR